MSIPKTLKEVVSSIPEVIDENTIEILQTEKWEVLKSDLLSTKELIKNHIVERQDVVDEIDQYLVMLGEIIPEEEGDNPMAYTSYCRVLLDSRQTVPTRVWTKLDLVDVKYDNDNEWDITNKRFIAKKAGYYHISYQVESGELDVNDFAKGGIFKNGLMYSVTGQVGANPVGYSQAQVGCDDIYLNVGDYIEIHVHIDDYNHSMENGLFINDQIYRNFVAIHRFA